MRRKSVKVRLLFAFDHFCGLFLTFCMFPSDFLRTFSYGKKPASLSCCPVYVPENAYAALFCQKSLHCGGSLIPPQEGSFPISGFSCFFSDYLYQDHLYRITIPFQQNASGFCCNAAHFPVLTFFIISLSSPPALHPAPRTAPCC